MYHFKEVVLKNKGIQKKRLVIVFDDDDKAMISEFLMSDALMFESELITDVEAVLNGRKSPFTSSGNRCTITVGQRVTTIEDLFADMYDNVPSYEPITIETELLLHTMKDWIEKLTAFEAEND